jgi:hypothetical protein
MTTQVIANSMAKTVNRVEHVERAEKFYMIYTFYTAKRSFATGSIGKPY